MKKILLAIACLWAACISCSEDTKIPTPLEKVSFRFIFGHFFSKNGTNLLSITLTIGFSRYSIPIRLTCFIITRRKMLFGHRRQQAEESKSIGLSWVNPAMWMLCLIIFRIFGFSFFRKNF